MDCAAVKAEFGSPDFYLNRLIQRALVEPKPLLKIYEEECQRYPDISLTVTFKVFQTALQRYRMTLVSRNQHASLQTKQPDLNHFNKHTTARFSTVGDFQDHRRRQRRLDVVPPAQVYQRLPHSPLERFSPQSSQVLNRNGYPPQAASETTFSSSTPGPHIPVEEEAPPPEFIEMSTNPPRVCDEPAQQNSEQRVKPDPESGKEAAQSSSPPANNLSILTTENTSPLNVRCVKCITALVTCAVMPCGHCCLCSICGQTVLSLKQVCPVCRKSVSNVIAYSNIICR